MPAPPPPAPFRLQRGKRIAYVSVPAPTAPATALTPAATLGSLTATARRLFPAPPGATESGPRLMVTMVGAGETTGGGIGGGGVGRGGPAASGSRGGRPAGGGEWVRLDEAVLASGALLSVVAVCFERASGWEGADDALAEGVD